MPAACYYHPSLPAVAICSRCGRSICSSCHKPYIDLALCPDCFYRKVPQQVATGKASHPAHTSFLPAGGVLYGPWPISRPLFPLMYLWIPAALLLIAAGLIVANAIALLSPPFFSFWTELFPWVAALGSLGFILGVILGLVVVGGFVLLLLGFRVLAVFFVFPAAILSLLIGGGFIVGLMIGVVASLLVIANQRHYPWQQTLRRDSRHSTRSSSRNLTVTRMTFRRVKIGQNHIS